MEKFKIGPFVKWAGGKKQLFRQLADRIPKSFGTYYEPFIGGGALLFGLQPTKAVINDVNEQLLNVYRQLQLNAQAVIDLIEKYDALACDKARYLEMRSQYNTKISNNILDAEEAALMIWLNKHCFNGLYRVNSKGLFNVPYNNRTKGGSIEADNLRNIGSYLNQNQIAIRYGDFASACEEVRAGDFVYFDSPYVPISQTASFTDYTKDGFTQADHERLAELYKMLDSRGAFLMLSNNQVPLVSELYSAFKIEEVEVRRSINRDATKRVGKEVIITNY